MYKMCFAFHLILMASLVGCNTSSSTSTLPVESQTPTVQPTSPMSTSTQTPAPPTLTPEPGLRTNGPYFAYFRQVPGFHAFQFVLMDADGGGRKVIDLPEEISNSDYQPDVQYVSPDGKWLVFYTGSAGQYKRGTITTGPYDLTLNLLDLTSGEKQTVTPLLSKNYPDNFAEAIKEINDPLMRPSELQVTFLAGITQALAWSPDGRYLAFAGQMDGLSSDLYLYDMTTKSVQRLSHDIEELQWIKWSPDGKWILHGSRLLNDLMGEYSINVVAVDNLAIRNLSSGFMSYWLNAHEILEYRMGIETYQLRVVDIGTGAITEIWKGYFNGYTVDPTGNWVALTAISSTVPPKAEEPGFVYGATQLIHLKSLEKIQVSSPLSDPRNLFLRAKDGTVIDLPNVIEMILASPDTEYWAVAVKQDLKIYTQDLTLVQEISVPLHDTNLRDVPFRPDGMQWNPDSSGLFLVYRANIYSVNIANGDIKLIETNLIGDFCSTCKWINGQ